MCFFKTQCAAGRRIANLAHGQPAAEDLARTNSSDEYECLSSSSDEVHEQDAAVPDPCASAGPREYFQIHTSSSSGGRAEMSLG